MTTVIRDSAGNIINIGPWDFQERLDEDGNRVVDNPLPPGATQADETVLQGRDGGLYAATDPRLNRKTLIERIADLEAKVP